MTNRELNDFIMKNQPSIDAQLELEIQALSIPESLKNSMLYSLQAGGKRIRPMLVLSVLRDFGREHKDALKVAAAIEMIHTYSLIHDDLPSMDNDDFRRGKLTNHKVFGEAVAILSGDALLTYSFEIIASLPTTSAEQKVELLLLLSKAAGAEGMVGGQVMDIEGEAKRLSLSELESVHIHKTGALLRFSIEAGAILSNASSYEREVLKEFAHHIGLAFQIQDDILDVTGTSEQLGKTAGKDEATEKSTYPSLLTLEGAQNKLKEHHELALLALEKIELNGLLLKNFADYIMNRQH